MAALATEAAALVASSTPKVYLSGRGHMTMAASLPTIDHLTGSPTSPYGSPTSIGSHADASHYLLLCRFAEALSRLARSCINPPTFASLSRAVARMRTVANRPSSATTLHWLSTFPQSGLRIP